MSSKTAIVGDKSVRLSPVYSAPATETVGRREQIKSFIAAWLGGGGTLPLHPILVGDPGLGKNRIVYECARLCGKELYIFQGHEEITADHLTCSVRFSDDPSKKMDYILSPIVTGMIRGGVVFLDEIAKIRPRALAPHLLGQTNKYVIGLEGRCAGWGCMLRGLLRIEPFSGATFCDRLFRLSRPTVGG